MLIAKDCQVKCQRQKVVFWGKLEYYFHSVESQEGFFHRVIFLCHLLISLDKFLS